MQLQILHYYCFVMSIFPTFNYHMKGLMCTELQSTPDTTFVFQKTLIYPFWLK